MPEVSPAVAAALEKQRQRQEQQAAKPQKPKRTNTKQSSAKRNRERYPWLEGKEPIRTRRERWRIEAIVYLRNEVHCQTCKDTWSYPNPTVLMRLTRQHRNGTQSVWETDQWPIQPPPDIPRVERLLTGQHSVTCPQCYPPIDEHTPDWFTKPCEVTLEIYDGNQYTVEQRESKPDTIEQYAEQFENMALEDFL